MVVQARTGQARYTYTQKKVHPSLSSLVGLPLIRPTPNNRMYMYCVCARARARVCVGRRLSTLRLAEGALREGLGGECGQLAGPGPLGQDRL